MKVLIETKMRENELTKLLPDVVFVAAEMRWTAVAMRRAITR